MFPVYLKLLNEGNLFQPSGCDRADSLCVCVFVLSSVCSALPSRFDLLLLLLSWHDTNCVRNQELPVSIATLSPGNWKGQQARRKKKRKTWETVCLWSVKHWPYTPNMLLRNGQCLKMPQLSTNERICANFDTREKRDGRLHWRKHDYGLLKATVGGHASHVNRCI